MKWMLLSERWKARLQWIVDVIINDWPWKAAALLLAIFIFFGIRQSISYTQTLNIAVETELDIGGLSLKGFEPNTVRVTFRGSESDIRRLSLRGSEPPRICLRLSQPPAGSTSMRVPIASSDLICDGDLRVVSIEPKVVVAQFDRTETRYLNIDSPVIRGASALERVKVSLEPSYVEISGPSERLNDLVERSVNLPTEVLDMTGRNESFTTTLRIQPPDTRSSWTLRPETVTATVEVIQEEITRTLTDCPIKIIQSAEGQSLCSLPSSVDIVLIGAPEELNAIDVSSVLAIVNPMIDENTTFPLEEEVEVLLPHHLRIKSVNITPSTIKVYEKELPKKEDLDVDAEKMK